MEDSVIHEQTKEAGLKSNNSTSTVPVSDKTCPEKSALVNQILRKQKKDAIKEELLSEFKK